MLKRLLKPRPAVAAGRALYASAVAQARTPELYAALGAPDTPEGRFEVYGVHVYLLLARLKDQGEQAAETSQAVFDAFTSALDHALRELAVGDLTVGKRMRKLAEAFYGRVKGYEAAFAALPDAGPLEGLLGRTVYGGAGAAPLADMAAYVLARRAVLADQPLERILAGEVTW